MSLMQVPCFTFNAFLSSHFFSFLFISFLPFLSPRVGDERPPPVRLTVAVFDMLCTTARLDGHFDPTLTLS